MYKFFTGSIRACRLEASLKNSIIRQQCRFLTQNTKSPSQQDFYDRLLVARGLGQKNAIGSLLMRCIVFDKDGKLTNVSAELKTKELLLTHELLPRDLRKIDKGYDDIVPSIVIKEKLVLLNLLHIKSIIKKDSVILFNYGSTDSHTYSVFLKDLESKLTTPTAVAGLPYEIRALEAIFISVVSNLHSEMLVHTTVIKGILQELDHHIDREKLRYLLIQSKKLSQFHKKAVLIRDLVEDLLEQDDELAGLYLTEKRAENDHQEVEILLENYVSHCDEIAQTVENLISNIKTTEEIINIILDSNRNQLMVLGLRFSIGLLSLGSLLFIGSLYGMNLENFIEEDDYWFFIVSTVAIASTVAVFFYGIKKLNRLQKVTMMGEDRRRPLLNKSDLSQRS